MDGYLTFDVRERVDSQGGRYFFGGLRLFNAVVFIRPDLFDLTLYHVTVKPYIGAASAEGDSPRKKP